MLMFSAFMRIYLTCMNIIKDGLFVEIICVCYLFPQIDYINYDIRKTKRI